MVRTLIVAGFTMEGTDEQSHYQAVRCSRPDMFGHVIQYVMLLSDQDRWDSAEQTPIENWPIASQIQWLGRDAG